MDLEKDALFWAGIALSLFFFGLAVLGAVGEVLGWWNDIGEQLISLGTTAGVLLAALTVLTGATRRQVAHVGHAVTAGNAKLDGANAKLDGANAKLDGANAKLDGANAKLDGANGKLDSLRDEVVHGFSEQARRLDRQVAVMDRALEQEELQSALLAEIRDRLPGSSQDGPTHRAP